MGLEDGSQRQPDRDLELVIFVFLDPEFHKGRILFYSYLYYLQLLA